MNVIEKVFGTHSERELKRILPIVDKIESLRDDMMALTDEQLKDKTKEYKKHVWHRGRDLRRPLPEAYATVPGSGTSCPEHGAFPRTVDRRYYPASGTYRRNENR